MNILGINVGISYIRLNTTPKMTKKEAYLKAISTKTTQLQALYGLVLTIPDSLFDELHQVAFPVADNPIPVTITVPTEPKANSENDWGKNKRLVIEILKANNKPMLKSDIIIQYQNRTGIQDATNIITNALAALRDDLKVKGYKPDGLKFRGFLWTLVSWWKDDKTILREYAITKPLFE
jgi:hypothetical protein